MSKGENTIEVPDSQDSASITSNQSPAHEERDGQNRPPTHQLSNDKSVSPNDPPPPPPSSQEPTTTTDNNDPPPRDPPPKTTAPSPEHDPPAPKSPRTTRLIKSLTTQISTLESQISSTTTSLSSTTSQLQDPSDGGTATVKRHIRLLHEYNEIKDVGQGLMGLIADARGVRHGEVQTEFGVVGD